jgi:hypothetical protein
MTAIQCNVAGNPAPRLYYERLKCDLRNEVNICYNRRPTNHRIEVYLYPVVPGNLQTIITGTKVNITIVMLTSEALRVLINRTFHGAPPFHLVFVFLREGD